MCSQFAKIPGIELCCSTHWKTCLCHLIMIPALRSNIYCHNHNIHEDSFYISNNFLLMKWSCCLFIYLTLYLSVRWWCTLCMYYLSTVFNAWLLELMCGIINISLHLFITMDSLLTCFDPLGLLSFLPLISLLYPFISLVFILLYSIFYIHA